MEDVVSPDVVWECGPGQRDRVADLVNAFGIPVDIEQTIRARDTVCVYCRGTMQEYACGSVTELGRVVAG